MIYRHVTEFSCKRKPTVNNQAIFLYFAVFGNIYCNLFLFFFSGFEDTRINLGRIPSKFYSPLKSNIIIISTWSTNLQTAFSFKINKIKILENSVQQVKKPIRIVFGPYSIHNIPQKHPKEDISSGLPEKSGVVSFITQLCKFLSIIHISLTL